MLRLFLLRTRFTRSNLSQGVSPPLGTNARFVVIRQPHLATVHFIPLTYLYEIIHVSRRHIVPRGSGRMNGEHKTRHGEGSYSSVLTRTRYDENARYSPHDHFLCHVFNDFVPFLEHENVNSTITYVPRQNLYSYRHIIILLRYIHHYNVHLYFRDVILMSF